MTPEEYKVAKEKTKHYEAVNNVVVCLENVAAACRSEKRQVTISVCDDSNTPKRYEDICLPLYLDSKIHAAIAESFASFCEGKAESLRRYQRDQL